jgi:hypothetical protein
LILAYFFASAANSFGHDIKAVDVWEIPVYRCTDFITFRIFFFWFVVSVVISEGRCCWSWLERDNLLEQVGTLSYSILGLAD